jgi:HlyD family secretion protein
MDRDLEPTFVRRRRLRRIAGALAVAGGAALVWLWVPGLVRPVVRRAAIRTGTVERGTVEALLQASGTVLPAVERVLASPVEARVLQLYHRPGEAVAAGERIVELELAGTRLELDRAVEQLARKGSESRQAGLELDRQIAELRGRREAKRLDAELFGYRLTQQRQLHAEGLTSEAALRQAEVEQQKTEVELRQLEEAIENARSATRERRESLEREITVLEQERDAARRRLELAEARTEASGVVTWAVADVGVTVRVGDPLARVADLGAFRVEGSVADAYASRLAVGLPVRIRVDDALLGGQVAVIHPVVAEGAARFDVVLDEPAHPAWRPNRRVDVFVVTDVRPDALRLPKGAFARAGRRQPVFVIRDDRAFRVEAEIGVSGHEHYEIVEGLSEGDEVILSDMKEYEHLQSVALR